MTPGERERPRLILTRPAIGCCAPRGIFRRCNCSTSPRRSAGLQAECIEHITLVENLVLGNIHNTLKGSVGAPTTEMGDDALVQRVTNRSVRATAPERIVPTGRMPHDQLLGRIRGGAPTHAEFVASTAYRCASTRFHILASASWIAINGCFRRRPRRAPSPAGRRSSWPRQVSRARPPHAENFTLEAAYWTTSKFTLHVNCSSGQLRGSYADDGKWFL